MTGFIYTWLPQPRSRAAWGAICSYHSEPNRPVLSPRCVCDWLIEKQWERRGVVGYGHWRHVERGLRQPRCGSLFWLPNTALRRPANTKCTFYGRCVASWADKVTAACARTCWGQNVSVNCWNKRWSASVVSVADVVRRKCIKTIRLSTRSVEMCCKNLGFKVF